jgi:hypothetical protein
MLWEVELFPRAKMLTPCNINCQRHRRRFPLCGGARSVRAEMDTVPIGCAVIHVKHTIRSLNLSEGNTLMNSIVYIVGAVVIILAILGFLGLR